MIFLEGTTFKNHLAVSQADKQEGKNDEISKTGAIPKTFIQNEAKEQQNTPKQYKKEILDRLPLNAEV